MVAKPLKSSFSTGLDGKNVKKILLGGGLLGKTVCSGAFGWNSHVQFAVHVRKNYVRAM